MVFTLVSFLFKVKEVLKHNEERFTLVNQCTQSLGELLVVVKKHAYDRYAITVLFCAILRHVNCTEQYRVYLYREYISYAIDLLCQNN